MWISRGFDPDGDSSVYSLNPPLNSSQYDPLPIPTPAPHNKVTWKPGISDSYQIPGDPTLTINGNGFLTVVPSEEGLFVFSVKCEEFRNGIKIGEVLRDFQLFVIDCPDPGNNPELQVKAPATEIFISQLDTIRLAVGDDRCFDFRVKDKDGGETIRLRAEAVNFKENIQSILSTSIGFLPGSDDTLGIQVCLPECPYLQDEPYIIDIIAEDNTCPLPLMDTLRLIVVVEPPPNKPPVFTLPQQQELFLSFFEGDTINVEFLAEDPDDDKLLLEIEGVEFDPEVFGIVIDTIEDSSGKMNFRLWWDTDCKKYPFAMQNDFQLKFYVEDADLCMLDNRDSVIVNIHVELPDNNAPVLTANGKPEDTELILVAGGNLSIDIKATDADSNDLITLIGSGIGFSTEEVGISFEAIPGKQEVRAMLNWNTYCDLLTQSVDGTYELMFIAEDADKCKIPNADTLRLKVTIIPPDNTAPELLINNESNIDTLWVTAGDQLDLNLTGFDSDGDSIALKMINSSLLDEIGALFNNKSGVGSISGNLDWQTDCADLAAGFQAAFYTFTFILQDFACAVPKNDMREITVVVKDRTLDFDFFVPNVFTPNQQDRINETYMVPDLPANNCEKQFNYVIIYNRWGKEVFRSEDINFQWTGEGHSTGVYYYILSYTGLDIKGTVSLLR
ncbi:MAG: gliding motility-associated C-terminal domain-containing protein [Cyclobacteriaceae bacterium]|nr:gliding motility-associated C-terminal domain-containing protein [Cyclobacteriaceae bacterium]